MKTIKDLTKEQVIEISKLIYPFSDTVEGEYEYHYQPYDPSWYEDAREYVQYKGNLLNGESNLIMKDLNKNT